MAYVVKWISRELDMTVDHSLRYEDPTRAIEFASNLRKLNPKKIWIEDETGKTHSDYEAIVRHRRA